MTLSLHTEVSVMSRLNETLERVFLATNNKKAPNDSPENLNLLAMNCLQFKNHFVPPSLRCWVVKVSHPYLVQRSILDSVTCFNVIIRYEVGFGDKGRGCPCPKLDTTSRICVRDGGGMALCIFAYIPYFEKQKSLMRSSCCLFSPLFVSVCLYMSRNFGYQASEMSYIHC
jgi:hypothetical protein